MIRELLRKDAVVLIGLFFAGIVAHFALYTDFNFEWMWVWGHSRFYEHAFALHYIFGLALGLFAALRDEVTRTEEFLRHRPVSDRLLFGTKMLGCFALMVSWLVLPLWAEWIVQGWGNPNKLIANTSHAWFYLGCGTVTFSSFAAAYFAGTWPGHWAVRFTLGATPALLILVACFGQPFAWTHPDQHPFAAVAIHLLATALLLRAAWQNQLAGRDPDHPVATPALRWSVPLAATAGCLLGASGLAELQREFSHEARHWYPEIAPRTDGSYYLRGLNPKTWPDVYEYVMFDQHHRVVGPAPDRDPRLPRPWSPRYSLPTATRRLPRHPRPAGLIEVGRTSYYVRCFLHPTDGHAHVVTTAGRGQPESKPSRRVLAKGTDKQPFSPLARRFGNSWDHLAMVWDEDGIWAYDLTGTADHFHRVPLPGDDRVLDWTTPSSHGGEDLGLDAKRLLVLGEKGTYGWNGTAFVPIQSPELPHWFRTMVSAVVTEVDPFTFTAVVPGKDGEPAFGHDYDLYNWREKLLATVVYAASLVRMPVLQVQSIFCGNARFSFTRSEFTDPLLAGHKRLWLLALNLLLAAALTLLAIWRLRRLGASQVRTLCWATAIAVGGVPLFLYYRFTETDRAWRRAPILKPAEIPPMWIQSA
ncbi:MAG: hypothetical protein ACYTFN_05525 [Planctomycetota bacterium]|jgi:hypothetical protein